MPSKEAFYYSKSKIVRAVSGLAKSFLADKADSAVWTVDPDFTVARARRLNTEAQRVGITLPLEAEEFLEENILGDEYRERWRAALTVVLIGLKVAGIRNEDERRRRTFSAFPGPYYKWIDGLNLGSLDQEKLVGTITRNIERT